MHICKPHKHAYIHLINISTYYIFVYLFILKVMCMDVFSLLCQLTGDLQKLVDSGTLTYEQALEMMPEQVTGSKGVGG